MAAQEGQVPAAGQMMEAEILPIEQGVGMEGSMADIVQGVIGEVSMNALLPTVGVSLKDRLLERLTLLEVEKRGSLGSTLAMHRQGYLDLLQRLGKRLASILIENPSRSRYLQDLQRIVQDINRQMFQEAALTAFLRSRGLESNEQKSVRVRQYRESLGVLMETQNMLETRQQEYPTLFGAKCPLAPPVDQQEEVPDPQEGLNRGYKHEGINEDLPTFSGELRDWKMFWDTFTALVDSNPRIAPILKLRKLIRSLKGEAYEEIRGFDFDEQSYLDIKAHLQDVFGKPERVLQVSWQRILAYNPLPDNPSYAAFGRFVRMVKEYVKYLLRLTPLAAHAPDQTLAMIRSKMPKPLRIRWLRLQETSVVEKSQLYPQLLIFLEEEMTILRNATLDEEGDRSLRNLLRGGKEKEEKKKTVHNFVASTEAKPAEAGGVARGTQQGKAKDPQGCIFCEEKHKSSNCKKEMDPNQRKKLVLKGRRCFICLEAGHQLQDCKAPTCTECQKKHHLLLHGASFNFIKKGKSKKASEAQQTS